MEQAEAARRVQESLMPKGVEHPWKARGGGAATPVQESLMPKGVEHTSPTGSARSLTGRVQESLMPKGVEHPRTVADRRQLAGAGITDAERR